MGEPAMMSLGWSEALAWRLRQQLLDPIGAASVVAVVRRLAAVPAYPDAAAELARSHAPWLRARSSRRMPFAAPRTC
jgi:hypothetical protein